MPQVSSAVASHPGLRRPGNEDAYSTRVDLGLYIVADGMGGHAAGEVASRMAIDAIESFIADTQLPTPEGYGWPVPYDDVLSFEGNRLRAAFLLANRRLSEAMAGDGALRGMATTAAAVLITASASAVAHVGDSRVYRWRGGELLPLTQDHSWVGEQVRAGVLTDDDARRHPWRNVVTRAIGGSAEPTVDVSALELAAGDRLLLCSDGLSAVVTHERLEGIFARGASLQETCDALIEVANDAGGPDNITALIVQIDVA